MSGGAPLARPALAGAAAVLPLVLADELDLRPRAPGLELGLEPGLDDALGELGAHHPGPHGDDLGVVALACALGRVGVVGLRGPDARNLVGADGHPDPGAAHQDGAAELAGCHLL